MILECKSCNKKFLVPDNAITKSGRLVQCSSCGNKWTQFHVNTRPKAQQIKEFAREISSNKKNTPQIKRKVKKKKTGPSIYSKEYLEKKHGIKLGAEKSNNKKVFTSKNTQSSYFGFYSYILLTIILFAFIIGVLNLTQNILINYFPFLEIYIEYIFENLEYFRIMFKDILSIF